MDVTIAGGKTRVHITGDSYPDVEAIRYRHGHDPQFLARSEARESGGPAVQLAPGGWKRNEIWVDGTFVPARVDSWSWAQREHCREVRIALGCLR
jgi:hypothetical protein